MFHYTEGRPVGLVKGKSTILSQNQVVVYSEAQIDLCDAKIVYRRADSNGMGFGHRSRPASPERRMLKPGRYIVVWSSRGGPAGSMSTVAQGNGVRWASRHGRL
jgi:hypothetical protein